MFISNRVSSILNLFVNDIFEQITSGSVSLFCLGIRHLLTTPSSGVSGSRISPPSCRLFLVVVVHLLPGGSDSYLPVQVGVASPRLFLVVVAASFARRFGLLPVCASRCCLPASLSWCGGGIFCREVWTFTCPCKLVLPTRLYHYFQRLSRFLARMFTPVTPTLINQTRLYAGY